MAFASHPFPVEVGAAAGAVAAQWATRASAELAGTHPVVMTRSPSTFWYSGLAGGRIAARARASDEPAAVSDHTRWAAGLALAAAEGSRLHLVGSGGDELFIAHPAHLYDYARSRPLAALGRIREFRARSRTPLRPLLADLADRRGFHQWLADWARSLHTPAPVMPRPGEDYPLTWGLELRMPPWATPEAATAVARLLGEAAAGAPRPLAPQRGQHTAFACVQSAGCGLRLANQANTAALETAAPYLDDAVIEAALAVRVADRNAPGRFKPVLADAMRTIVPDSLLQRRTKGDYSPDVYRGLRHNRDAIRDLFADSALARAGLIDADVLRANLLGLHTEPNVMRHLDPTIGCELWLRAHNPRAGVPRTAFIGASP